MIIFSIRRTSRREKKCRLSIIIIDSPDDDDDVALKATTTTVLMMANQNKRASSTIVNSTASGANPEPTVKAAGGIADWPLEKKFVGFCFAMFGFFAFFMLMPGSAQLWFGPNPPFPKFTHVPCPIGTSMLEVSSRIGGRE